MAQGRVMNKRSNQAEDIVIRVENPIQDLW